MVRYNGLVWSNIAVPALLPSCIYNPWSKLVTQLSPQTLTELNIQVAQFRDLLLAVGSAKDCPDLRERIRKVRMEAVEEVMRTNNSLLPHVKK